MPRRSPAGQFAQKLDPTDPLVTRTAAARTISVHGFSVLDNDETWQTPGVGSVLLFGQTPIVRTQGRLMSASARSARSFGPRYSSAARQRRPATVRADELGEGTDPATGLIQASEGLQVGDYAAWARRAVSRRAGWRERVVTNGFAVQAGDYVTIRGLSDDYLSISTAC